MLDNKQIHQTIKKDKLMHHMEARDVHPENTTSLFWDTEVVMDRYFIASLDK
jgi:hypothetical protein